MIRPRAGSSGCDGGTTFGPVLISARTFGEYRAMFDLDDADLAGTLLDCPGGAASFTAEALQRGIDVTAADPAYSPAPLGASDPAASRASEPPQAGVSGRGKDRQEELRQRAEHLHALGQRAAVEAERGHAWVQAHAADYTWKFFSGPEEHLAQRLAAAALFTAHVSRAPQHYVPAALPHLPFADAAFDLVLCSHLLFSYANRLDEHFHLAALRELVRVARGQVRVYPLVANGSDRSHPSLGALRAQLAAAGVGSELRATGGYAFQRGADRVLVLQRAAPERSDVRHSQGWPA